MLISDSRNEIYRSKFGGLKKKKKSLAQMCSPQSVSGKCFPASCHLIYIYSHCLHDTRVKLASVPASGIYYLHLDC